MKSLILVSAAALALAACSPKVPPTVIKEVIVEVPVPVLTPCKVEADPAPVAPLKEEFSDDQWALLTPQQKAALVARQGLKHQNDATVVRANSSSCPVA